eukprot:6269810-Prymnesium_polylepis.1
MAMSADVMRSWTERLITEVPERAHAYSAYAARVAGAASRAAAAAARTGGAISRFKFWRPCPPLRSCRRTTQWGLRQPL